MEQLLGGLALILSKNQMELLVLLVEEKYHLIEEEEWK